MYRTVFTPTETNSMIPFNIPREWYGRNIEFIAFPVDISWKIAEKKERKFQKIPAKYLFGTKNFKFNRDEANDYE